jgi:predicted DNA-binding ribbon-helix-helix protein
MPATFKLFNFQLDILLWDTGRNAIRVRCIAKSAVRIWTSIIAGGLRTLVSLEIAFWVSLSFSNVLARANSLTSTFLLKSL